MGFIATTARIAAGKAGFALAAAATIESANARDSLSPVASSSRKEAMREASHRKGMAAMTDFERG